mmetsp:Transcript_10036/g.13259  ORF Transcript_10036/g.13259 Transcript_10036/m.13259 type:complete len:80 (-) Transcript_10036:164-403(-)
MIDLPASSKLVRTMSSPSSFLLDIKICDRCCLGATLEHLETPSLGTADDGVHASTAWREARKRMIETSLLIPLLDISWY